MHALAIRSRSAGVPGRALAMLVVLVVGLAAVFVVAPPRLAATGPTRDLADQERLVAEFRAGVVGYWFSGDRNLSPDLQRVVDYWFRFHLVKGGTAALLLLVLCALTVLLWRTFLRADGLGTVGRAVLASAGGAVSMLALFALAVVVANVQGAMAPFASLLPLLMEDPTDAGLAGPLAEARQQLTDTHRSGGFTPPALDAMVSDFAWYHAALALQAAVVLVGLVGLSVMMWRRFARAGRPARLVWGWFGAFSALSSLMMAVILVANAGTAMDPAPALLALFNGGF